MNVEADNINQVKSGLAIVKTNVEGLNKNVVEAKQSAISAQEKVNTITTQIVALVLTTTFCYRKTHVFYVMLCTLCFLIRIQF